MIIYILLLEGRKSYWHIQYTTYCQMKMRKENQFVLIEEPENHLHKSMQIALSQILLPIANTHTCL